MLNKFPLLVSLLCGLVFCNPVQAQYISLNDFDKYEPSYFKDLPLGEILPINFDTAIVEIDIETKEDHNEFREKHFSFDPSRIRDELAKHVVVRREEWANITPMHNTEIEGWIQLEDGTPLQFWLNNGGMAKTIYPDGGVVYLLKPSTNWTRGTNKPELYDNIKHQTDPSVGWQSRPCVAPCVPTTLK